MSRSFLLHAAWAALLCTSAFADIVTLKDGRTMEGEILQEDDKTLKIKMKSGSLTIEQKDVASIERKATADQEYRQRLAKADAGSPKAQLELGLWAGSKGMDAECVKHCLAAARLDPTLVAAGDELEKRDWHFVEGVWQDPDTYYPAKGYLKLDGKWLMPLEHAWRMSQKELQKQSAAKEVAKNAVGKALEKKRKNEALIEADKARIPKLQAEIEVARLDRDKAYESVAAAEKHLEKVKGDLGNLEGKLGADNKSSDLVNQVKDAKRKVAAAEAAVKRAMPPVTAAEKRRQAGEDEKVEIAAREYNQGYTKPAIEEEIRAAEEALKAAEATHKTAVDQEAEAKSNWERTK